MIRTRREAPVRHRPVSVSVHAVSLCVVLSALACGLGPAVAEPATAAISLELNKAEEQAGGCRLYLVLANRSPDNYSSYRLDLVVFGKDDVIARRFAVDVGPLRPEKTMVKLFDVNGVACRDVGKVLLNDVMSCTVGKDARSGCIDHVTVTSRTALGFTK